MTDGSALVDPDGESVPDVELFVDDRGAALKVAWDTEHSVAVISMWRDGRCIGTHRLDNTDTVRLASLLTSGWIDGLRKTISG